jgi:hypothetical protein
MIACKLSLIAKRSLIKSGSNLGLKMKIKAETGAEHFFQSSTLIYYFRFPRTLGFSRAFINCCEQIRLFVTGFYHFAEGFEQQHNEMDDLLKKVFKIYSSVMSINRKLR